MSSRPRFLGPSDRVGAFTDDAGSTGTDRETWGSFTGTWTSSTVPHP
jgi:hypothetical protein